MIKHKLTALQRAKLRTQFHKLIQRRAGDLVEEHRLQLPQLKDLKSDPENPSWFPIPGMYGGFKFWLVYEDDKPFIISESWCRIVEGSGQRHRITTDSIKLVESGFV
jgi:hypothetical protein